MAASGSGPLVLLVNPAAGKGRAAARADAVGRALAALGPVERFDSRAPGDEVRIAREAAERGARVLAVVGGDGSINRAASGLVAAGAATPLAIFSAGTGNDFAKSVDIPVDEIGAMVARVARGRTRDVDVGFVDDVLFVNAAGFGFGVAVLERMQRPGVLRGAAAYVGTALRALIGYRGFRARMTDEAEPRDRLMLVFANGGYVGGAFHIAPGAALDDGLLDVVAIGNAPSLRRVSLFARALRGAHLGQGDVDHRRLDRVRVMFDTPPQFEVDGDLHRARNAEVVIRVHPKALRIVV